MKIISWNVNGIRAIAKKNFFTEIEGLNADIICLQETKAQDDQVAETLEPLKHNHIYCNSALRPGYSGTAVISGIKPLKVTKDIGISEHDTEGRVQCLDFGQFFLVNVYVPNSGAELARLDYRQEWDKAFFEYLKDLEKIKPLVICGDLNVAHKPIDLARPQANYNKSAGYMQEEIDGMDRLVQGGFTDTFLPAFLSRFPGKIFLVELQGSGKVKEHRLENRLFPGKPVVPSKSERCIYIRRNHRI